MAENKKIDEMFDENGRFIPRYARGIKTSGEKGLCGLDLEIRKINESWQEARCSGRGIATSVLEATTADVVALHCRSCRKNSLPKSSFLGPVPWTDPVSGRDYIVYPDDSAERYLGLGYRIWEIEALKRGRR